MHHMVHFVIWNQILICTAICTNLYQYKTWPWSCNKESDVITIKIRWMTETSTHTPLPLHIETFRPTFLKSRGMLLSELPTPFHSEYNVVNSSISPFSDSPPLSCEHKPFCLPAQSVFFIFFSFCLIIKLTEKHLPFTFNCPFFHNVKWAHVYWKNDRLILIKHCTPWGCWNEEAFSSEKKNLFILSPTIQTRKLNLGI